MTAVRVGLLVLLLLGCRSQRALTTAQPEGGLAEDAGVAIDAPTGAAPDLLIPPQLPDAFAAGAPDRPPPVDRPPLGDRPPLVDLGPAPKCEVDGTFNACVEHGDGRDYFRRLEGNQCGLCKLGRDAAPGSVAHCLIGDPDDTIVYCARSCFDCCHTVRGAPCQVNADCCAPLVCTAAGALRICDL